MCQRPRGRQLLSPCCRERTLLQDERSQFARSATQISETTCADRRSRWKRWWGCLIEEKLLTETVPGRNRERRSTKGCPLRVGEGPSCRQLRLPSLSERTLFEDERLQLPRSPTFIGEATHPERRARWPLSCLQEELLAETILCRNRPWAERDRRKD